MANQHHLELLRKGTNVWNDWRRENPRIKPDISGADLCGADLAGANLQEVCFSSAIIRDTNLQGANLRGATGISEKSFAGANLAGVIMPDDVKEFEGLRNVEEAAKNARKLFFSILLACLYTLLTIAITTDSQLLTNSASSPLPIIRTEIPIVGFYFAAPILLLCFFLYFHLCLQRLWEGLSDLPAVFPNAMRLDHRAYPWLLIGLIRAHFRLLRNDRQLLSHLEEMISTLLAWWLVSTTIFPVWVDIFAATIGF